MPDESQVVRGIDWKSTFPFTQIFRSFRIAIHPSKIVLALVALILIYSGGRLLDTIWPRNYTAMPGEIGGYHASISQPNGATLFASQRTAARQAVESDYRAELARIGKPDGNLRDIKYRILQDRDAAVAEANRVYEAAAAQGADSARREALDATRDATIREAFETASERYDRAEQIKGIGPFAAFFDYENMMLGRMFDAGRSGMWLGRDGFFDQFINVLVVAPGWAFRYHYIYFTIFTIFALLVWAIFGGAIARIAAVQVARDEKISIRQALSFSTAKFLSFVSAPIIPLLIILIVGLVVAAGGLLNNIPHLGPVIVGAVFFLALAAGFVMTLVLIGLLGGFNLMYPTIAVEGSDSFDAISRSFSYLFARPWRLLFYTAVALLYGALCYLFVRFFIKLMLALTHHFVNMTDFSGAANSNGAVPLWPTMWPSPAATDQLAYNIDFLSLSGGEDIGAFLVAVWNYLAIGTLGAFVISFYFSANTIIYALMRQEVDATEMDDVYLEQTEEDFSEPLPSAAPVATTTTVITSDTPATGSAAGGGGGGGDAGGQPIPESPPGPLAENVPPPESAAPLSPGDSPYRPDEKTGQTDQNSQQNP